MFLLELLGKIEYIIYRKYEQFPENSDATSGQKTES